jgi:hypothetical protein
VGGVKHPVSAITPRPAVTAAAWRSGLDATVVDATALSELRGKNPSASPARSLDDRTAGATPVAPRPFGGRFANAAAMQDVTSLARHLDGCTQEFWRTLGRDHGAVMTGAIEVPER